MSITFNPDKYKELLITYLPKLIKTEAENEQALAIVEELMHQTRTPEEDEVYQLLITLVEKFEQENYPLNQPQNQLSMLLFLLDQSHKSRNDLILFLGSELPVRPFFRELEEKLRRGERLTNKLRINSSGKPK
jgi:HTH-type transcriptional regulator/antitoxin HigA